MLDVRIKCVSKGFGGTQWTLRFEDAGSLTLYDPQSAAIRTIQPQEAPGAIQLPSFSQSIKHVGIVLPDGRMLEFAAEPTLMRPLKEYMDRSLVTVGGPAAIAAMRRSGYWELFGGIGLAILGVVITVATYTAASQQGGKYYITWGLVLWGLVMVGRGIAKVVRAGQLVPQAPPV